MTGFPPHIGFLSSTRAQNWLVSAILGCAPGIYLAITGLGAGAGQENSARFSQIQNCLGNGVFGLASFFSPLLLRYCNVRWFLILGPTGYAAYIVGLMYFQARDELVFPLVLGIYFGLGSACVWVGTTYISMSYSTPATKGMFINNQWVGLATGSITGSAIAFGANFHKSRAAGVSYGVLGAWLAIHLGAAVAAFFLILPSRRVHSTAGHNIPAGRQIMLGQTPRAILGEILKTFTNPRVAIVLATMLTSDFWLVFIGRWNSRNFSLRARSLNTFLYWIIQLPTAELLTVLLDRKGWTMRKRGMAGFCVLCLLVCASWAGFYAWQYHHPESADPHQKIDVLDWADGHQYVRGLVVYLVFGLAYPTYHVVLVFYMSLLSGEGDRKMAYYSGIFKGLQGCGISIAFGIGSTSPNYMTEGICYGATAIASLLPLGYAFTKYLEDTEGRDDFIEPSVVEVGDTLSERQGADDEDDKNVASPVPKALSVTTAPVFRSC